MNQLPQYKGALSPAHAAEGIRLARANAARLIADAELLLENDRHATAGAIAILAIEELGKVQAIKTIALFPDGAQLKQAWRDYRSHRAKNVQWILPKLAAEGARTMMQLRAAADSGADHTAMLDVVKQLCLYTDCYGNAARWSDPASAVEPDFSRAILATAKILNREQITTARELELWASIVGPHYDKPTMTDALFRFQEQAFAEGLTTTTREAMEAFVSGRPVEVRS